MTRARLFVLCAAGQAAIVTMNPCVAVAQAPQSAPSPRSTPSTPSTPTNAAPRTAGQASGPAAPSAVADPTMFAIEGDGAGGPAIPPAPTPPTPKPSEPVPSWRENGSWGWLVVVTSLGLGIATTAYGLTIRCADDATQCRKNTSLAIWGGVGLAAVGSAFGILIVQMGRARVQAKPAVFAGDWTRSHDGLARPLVPGLLLEGSFL